MPAGIEIYNYVTNQKGSPAIWSDLFAARPPAGFIGRLFVSTDTFEIYRDNGITWDLIGGSGGPTVNIYNSDGTLTGTRVVTMAGNNLTFEGGASTARIAMSANNNVPRIFSFRTAGVQRWAFRVDGNETGANAGAHFALRAYNDAGSFFISPIIVERSTGQKVFLASETITTSTEALQGVYNLTTVTMAAGVSLTGGNPHAAAHNNYTVINSGSYTVNDSIFFGAQSNVLRLTSNGSGTATFTQTGNVRSAAANLNQVQYDTSNGSAITYTHVAVGQNLGIYKLSAAGSLAITNAYNLLLNDLNEYGNANLTITNRWGIFQNSVIDVNYFGGTTLIGTTINAGYKTDIFGTLRNTLSAYFASTSGQVGIGTLLPKSKLHVLLATTSGTTTGPVGTVITAQNSSPHGDSYISIVSSFDAESGIIFTDESAAYRGKIIYEHGPESMSFYTLGSVKQIITSAGNVGINTITPLAKLDIIGNVRIDSSLLLVPTTTVPTATAGTLYYDSASNKLKLYDGTSFVNLN